MLTLICRRDYGQTFETRFILPSIWLALWSASTFVGQMIGSIMTGWLQDKRGRKPTLVFGSSISFVAVAMCFISYLPENIDARRGIFLAGKTMMGIALGVLMATTQTFISEITSPDLRGPALALLPINILLGQLIGAGVVYGVSRETSQRSYLIALATQWPLSLLILVVALKMPESPAYLVANGRYSAALRSLAKFHTSRVDLPSKLEEVRHSVKHEEQFSNAHRYLDCFVRIHRRQTFIVLFAGIIPQLFGLAILSQASYFMQIVGMAPSMSLVVLLLGILLGLIANIIGVFALGKVGRRTLILACLSISTFLWFGMGVAGFWSGPATVWYALAIILDASSD